MDPQQLDDVAARVVAWHNRHPLARRIGAAQVAGIGVVVLPFRERPGAAPEPAFSEDFIAPLRPRQVARWALRHGWTELADAADWPQREVLADAAAGEMPLYLLTAAIEAGGQRRRLLIGRGRGTPLAVTGPRLYDRRRIGASLAGVTLLSALVLASVVGPWPPGGDAAAVSVASASASVRAASPPAANARAAVAPAASAAASAIAMTQLAAAEPASAPVTEATAAAPVDTSPASAAAEGGAPAPLAAIKPELSPEVREAAIREARALRAADPPPPAAPSASTAAPSASAAAVAASASAAAAPVPAPQLAPAPPGRLYALVTRPTPTRAESLALLNLLRSAAANAPPPVGANKELVELRREWQAAWWPFATREDAERARSMLAVRGLRVELVDF